MSKTLKTIALATFLILVGGRIFAQVKKDSSGEKGIHFETGLTWYNVLAKAKAENKYIFVDFYATWCGPCKTMDRQVYPNDTVGNYMNDKFISVKVQIDRTPADDTTIKQWYGIADYLRKAYTVTALPTFLFFSPDGKPVHKLVGAKLPANVFLANVKDVFDPSKQYYSILNNYKPGLLDLDETKGLALAVRYDKNLSGKIAVDYLDRIGPGSYFTKDNINFIGNFSENKQVKNIIFNQVKHYDPRNFQDKSHQTLLSYFSNEPEFQEAVKSYLASLSENQLKEKANLLLLTDFTQIIRLNDKYFNIFFKNSAKSDKAMVATGNSEYVVDKVLYSEIVQPELLKADSLGIDVNWKSLDLTIRTRTNANCSLRNIKSAQKRFYGMELRKAEQQKSNERFKWGGKYATAIANGLTIKEINARPNVPVNAMAYDSGAWIIFEYSHDESEFEKALVLVNKALMTNAYRAESLDTKANLLYKMGGDKEEALKLEAQSLTLNPKAADVAQNFRKMKEGKPTWPEPSNN